MEFDTTLDQQAVKDNITKYSSTKLAEMVIAYRYLGLYQEISIAAMEELSARRNAGDTFEYEAYIKEKMDGLPKLDFKMPDLLSLFKKMKFGGIK